MRALSASLLALVGIVPIANADTPAPSSVLMPVPPPVLPSRPAASIGDPSLFLPRRYGIGWDFEIQLGLRVVDSKEAHSDLSLTRAQTGVLFVREPFVLAIDATAEFGGIADPGFGGQISLTHVWSGLWTHIGVTSARRNDLGFSMAAGLSLFGVEFQRRMDLSGAGENALFAVARIPIGTAFFLFTTKATPTGPSNYDWRNVSWP
jgi:hypothetical protein